MSNFISNSSSRIVPDRLHINLADSIGLSELPAAYHKHPLHHATTPGYDETDPSILRNSSGGEIESTIASSGQQTPVIIRAEPSSSGGLRVASAAEGLEETSHLGEDVEEEAGVVGLVQSINNPPINRLRLLSACLLSLANGLNDAAPGALIPYMESYYNIGYGTVSLIFLANAAGFVAMAFVSQPLHAWLGRSVTFVLGTGLMVAGYLIMVLTPGVFGVVVLSFFLTGAGMALILAQNNVFCSNLAGTATLYGYVHGSYGIGGTISPLIATAMASRGILWTRFYFILLCLTLFNMLFSAYVFRNSEKENITSTAATAVEEMSKSKILKKSLKNKYTIMTAIFIFAYQGAEVAIGGWTVSFLVSVRGGDLASVGYVVAGFWAGITLGRFFLTHLCHRLGELPSVFLLTLFSTLFEILVWTVPNIITNAVSVALVGLLLGPVYPCAMTVATRLIERNLHMSSIALISAVGSSGGAVAPFVTGLAAARAGAWVLQPVAIGLFLVMMAVWGGLPRGKKRE